MIRGSLADFATMGHVRTAPAFEPRRRLTEGEKIEIRKSTGPLAVVAQKYNISTTWAGLIRRGKSRSV